MKSNKAILALALLLCSLAYGQSSNPGRVSVTTTAWSTNWLLHPDDATACSDLGMSAYMQSLLGNADAGAMLTDFGISAYIQSILGDANAGAVLAHLGVSAWSQSVLADTDAAARRASLDISPTDDSVTLGLASARLADGQLIAGTTVTVWGDSFTAGIGASPASSAYVPVLAGLVGWTATTHAISGAQTIDGHATIHAHTPVAAENVVYYYGVNDQRGWTAATEYAWYQSAALEELIWLGTLATNKHIARDASVAKTGTWSNTPVDSVGMKTTTVGDSLSTTVVGSSVAIAYLRQVSNEARFSVTIDGGLYQIVDVNVPVGFTSVALSQSWGPAVWVFGGLQDKPHTVTVALYDHVAGDDTLYVQYIAGFTPQNQEDLPQLYVVNVPRMTAAGYASTGGSDSGVAYYNTMLANDVAALRKLGLRATLVDVAQIIDPATDLGGDGIHPNNTGHGKIAAAIAQAVTRVNVQPSPDLDNALWMHHTDFAYAVPYGTHVLGATPMDPNLPAGVYIGQRVTFYNKGGGTCDISVAFHATSNPEIIRLDTAGEYLDLTWDGVDWIETGGAGQTYP